MDLNGAIVSFLLLSGAALGLVASLRSSRRDAHKQADRRRNRLIKERLNEPPPPVTRVPRFPEHADH